MTSAQPTTGPDGALRLERRADGQLWAMRDGSECAVFVCRCFPWSSPARNLSLRDRDEEEFAYVADPAVLETGSRDALERSLAEAGFVFEIEGIEAVEEEIEIRTWKVVTRVGPRSFQTKRDEWPRDVPGGGLLIRDVAGDLFLVPDPTQLDGASQRRLWAFMD